MTAEPLTTLREYDNNGAATEGSKVTPAVAVPHGLRAHEFPSREDGMDFEKDNFEDDNELSRLEEEDELGGDGEEIVETEEEELVISEPGPEAGAPAPKAAPRPAAKPPKKAAPKKAKKKAKKAKPKAKKKAAKKAKKPAKKKRRR